ncbi:MAG: XdhC family protein [bacterium]
MIKCSWPSTNADPLWGSPSVTYLEHAKDIFGKWLTWKAEGGVALVIVTSTDGGAVRAPGAMMAVSESGEQAGYISGGCIDADVVLQAQGAIKSGKPQLLRYGAGSPFIDLPLPCGGTIEVVILPHADTETVRDRLRMHFDGQIWVHGMPQGRNRECERAEIRRCRPDTPTLSRDCWTPCDVFSNGLLGRAVANWQHAGRPFSACQRRANYRLDPRRRAI